MPLNLSNRADPRLRHALYVYNVSDKLGKLLEETLGVVEVYRR